MEVITMDSKVYKDLVGKNSTNCRLRGKGTGYAQRGK